MKFDFDKPVNRRKTDSYKWDSAENDLVLPMWVADMDFTTAPVIIDALRERVNHGIFGYTLVPLSYYRSVKDWFERRHNWLIDPEWIIYTSGVVPAISAIIKALTQPGDKILVQTPVYNCFFSSIRNNKCEIVSSPLIHLDDTYVMDFEDLELKASDPKVKIMLLCNPHNPVGRVWKNDELLRLGEICIRNGVTVISDEIHCELVYPGYQYIPFASISPEFSMNSVTCISVSKAFNVAGLQIANIVSENKYFRTLIDRAINDNEVCDVNPFGVIATQAAYNKGEEWLSQLIDYLYENYKFMKEFCKDNLPDFPITKLEATYLVWMDCRKLNLDSDKLEHMLIDNVQLWLNAGTMYGNEGQGFMRWNIACPRSRLIEGLIRFKTFIDCQES